MGFSLVGNSGDTKTTTNVYETSYSASLNPQLDLQGSGAGAAAINVSPLLQGSSIGNYAPNVSNAYAPINVVTTGSNLGDAALAALNALLATQTAATSAPGTGQATSSLSSLFTGNTGYYILAAIVVFFLAHHKKA